MVAVGHKLSRRAVGVARALWLTMGVSRLPGRLTDGLSGIYVQHQPFGNATPGRQPGFCHCCVPSGRTALHWAARLADQVITAFTANTIKHEHHRYLRSETRFARHASLPAGA